MGKKIPQLQLFIAILLRVLLTSAPEALVKELKVKRKVKFCIEKNRFLTFKK